RDGTVRFWDAATGKFSAEPLRHPRGVPGVALSRDQSTVITASEDGTARIWDLFMDRPDRSSILLGHPQAVDSVAFSPDGRTVLTACWDGPARLWYAATGQELRQFRGDKGRLHVAKFSPDGKTVVTAAGNGTAQLWEVDS